MGGSESGQKGGADDTNYIENYLGEIL